MRRKLRLYAVVSLLLASGGLGLANQEEHGVLTNSATVHVRDYTITIHTDKEIYDPDNAVVLIVTIKYSGAGQANVSNDPGPIFSNTTVLRDGEACPYTLFGKQTIKNPFNYGHGAGVSSGWEGSFRYHLNRAFDMTSTGEYRISMRWYAPDRQSPSGEIPIDCGPIIIHIQDSGLKPKKEAEIQSEVITVGVREDQPLNAKVAQIKDVLNKAHIPISDLGCDCGSGGISLHLEGRSVRDITALSGFSIYRLILHNTAVMDLSPLRSCPVRVLSLLDSPVRDLSPLEGTGVEWLDLRGTAITNFSPLARMPRLSRVFLTEPQMRQDMALFQGIRALVFEPRNEHEPISDP